MPDEVIFDKTNVPGLVRDRSRSLLLNTRNDEYETILAQRKKNKEFRELQTRVEKLERTVEMLQERLENVS